VKLTRLSMGASVAVLCVVAVLAPQSAHAQTYKVLYTFTLGKDGGVPEAGLIRDANGNLYGTTALGGRGSGTVFKLSPTGKETVLYSFCSAGNCADGSCPAAGVILDRKGNLYGTAYGGGSLCGQGGSGNGVVFELSPKGKGQWKETVLYTFKGAPDGANPAAGVILDTKGNLYGTTQFGGGGGGTVFKLSKTGKETVLYQFTGGNDGAFPVAGVTRDSKGNLYGTTYNGGMHFYGTVFKLSQTGKETVLHSFTGGSDGGYPRGGVIQGAKYLYGTAFIGGKLSCTFSNVPGCGVVFKLNMTGKETVLYSFNGGTDAAGPAAGVILDAKGNLYGTTQSGGAGGAGTVFELSKTGNETVLYPFTGGADGAFPVAGVIQDAKGNLYGTTPSGGVYNAGVAFKLTP
jgi:uncharacterized repeat protein (TIGR03803 family)